MCGDNLARSHSLNTMRSLSGAAFVSLSAALFVSAQEAAEWCDEGQTGVCFHRYHDEAQDIGWGYLFPESNPDGSVPNELIGIYTAPSAVGWVGNSLGGGMRFSPLVLGWIHENTAMASLRNAEEYGPPRIWGDGPTLTVLGGSGVTADGQQRIIWRCQNCTTWESSNGPGGINLSGTAPVGFAAHGSIKPLEPSVSDSPVYMHTVAGIHRLEVPEAKSADYWDILKKLQDTPQLPDPNAPTPTTTTSTTIPTTTTTSTTATPTATSAPEPTTLPTCPGTAAAAYPLVIADGWKATAVLGRLRRPRSILFDNRGRLLVLESGRGVSVHTLDEAGCVTNSTLLISDATLNHALDLHPNGNKIIASSSNIAWSWDYDPVALTAYNKKTLVYGMHNPGHVSRTVWISRKYPDYVMISVGSDGNVDIPSFEKPSGRAQIRVFDMRTLPPNGIPYTSGGVMGYGIRNDVGITEDREGTVYSVENSVDNAFRLIDGVRKDIHNDNPAEKVYRLGDPRNPSGLFGGYPYCFTVWEGGDFTDSVKVPGDWFTQAPNATMNDEWCDKNAVKPIALLPPHTAPLDFKFAPRVNDGNLYVGLHGSWNRSPPQGYKVVTIPGNFSSAGAWSPSVDLTAASAGFKDLLANVDEARCQSGCFRPVGLAFAKEGDWLYVSSDSSGEIVVLKRERDPTSPPIPTTTVTPTSTTSATTPTSTSPNSPQQSAWGQCGGRNYSGPTACPSGQVCNYVNLYFSQCIRG